MAVTAAKESGDPAGEGRSKVRASKRQKTVRVFNAAPGVGHPLGCRRAWPGAYAWHAYQVHRTARAFLERADQLEADQDWTTAASYLHRYLSLQPEDSRARIRMAKTFDRGAKDWQQKSLAVNLYYDTLGLIPEKEQAAPRRRLAELLLEIRRFTAAEAEATKLLAADDKDPQGRRLLAPCSTHRCSPAQRSPNPRAVGPSTRSSSRPCKTIPATSSFRRSWRGFIAATNNCSTARSGRCGRPSGRNKPTS